MVLKRFFIKKIDISKVDKRKFMDKLDDLGDKFYQLYQNINTPKYLYWDKVKYKSNLVNISPENVWSLCRQLRNYVAVKTVVKSETGEFFKWIRLPYTDEFLNKIDMLAGGSIFQRASVLSSDKQLVLKGIMEEAIASSQLEGAHTTHARAKKMILEGIPPKNVSEKMILNNYRTIISIEEDYKDVGLSMDLIFELHKRLTEGTIDLKDQGRLRRDEDDVRVSGLIGNQEYITHIPPKTVFLKKEMIRLVKFANDDDEKGFIHPIIKAIFIHFWIGYLHPFTDGNGRLARTLFYWYLLKKGYWTMIYLPISKVIKDAPSQYSMAYIYSEQDNYDLTYFYDFHMHKIIQALDNFKSYLLTKTEKNKQLEKMIDSQVILNDRQKRLLRYLLSDKGATSTMSSHSELNNISRQTAAKDLKELENYGLTYSRKEGKYVRFYASVELISKINKK